MQDSLNIAIQNKENDQLVPMCSLKLSNAVSTIASPSAYFDGSTVLGLDEICGWPGQIVSNALDFRAIRRNWVDKMRHSQ